jgi:serine/threonine-protein kinase
MGVIHRGWDNLLNCPIAFKILLERHRGRPELRRRFMEEARTTARLQHPCIVPVYDMGELPDSGLFFSMRLIRGQSLTALLASRAADLPRLIMVFEQVCQAVAHAHTEKVVHRDLKPGNVMVAPHGVVYVMDWGVAKDLTEPPDPPPPDDLFLPPGEGAAQPATEAGRVMGTPAYMAPEQARGEPVCERADVFGLGAILCEVLTGRPPYDCANGGRAHRRAMRGDLARAQADLSACAGPREMVELARRCLALRPGDRPRDGAEVASEVTAYLESDQRRVERDMARFFDLSLDLFCLAGLDGHFRRINPNFSRVLGHPEAELLGRPFLDFVHPDDHDATLAALGQLARGLPVVRFRNRYLHARGGHRWFEWTAKSIPEEGIIFAVARDVTAEYAPC